MATELTTRFATRFDAKETKPARQLRFLHKLGGRVRAGFQRRFEREVGATPAEFRRALALAHPDVVEQSDGSLQLAHGTVRLCIRYAPQPSRRLGLFVLPVLHVSYDFESGSPDACQALLAHLDLAMQRGGG